MRETSATPKSYCYCIEHSSFYWKNLDSTSATVMLSRLPVGSFLVRPSQKPGYEYVLSQKITDRRNGIKHIRIERDNSGRYLLDTDLSAVKLAIVRFSCVANLIKSWRSVFYERGQRYVLTPVSNCLDCESSNYVNEDSRGVCFHDDKEADQSFRNFFTKLRSQIS